MTTAYRMAFREWFGIPPAEADILVALYAANGEFRQAKQLLPETCSPTTVWERVRVLRQALEAEAIDCIPRQGYRLTDTGMAECRAALWTMGEELRRAS